MKTRNSLVSNSSSSSFVLIAPEESHNEAMKTLSSDIARRFILSFVEFDQIFDRRVVIVHQMNDSGGFGVPNFVNVIGDVLEDVSEDDYDEMYEDLMDEKEVYQQTLKQGDHIISELDG